MDPTTVEVIIQGGGVGLALVSLGLVGYALRTLMNHLPHMAVNMEHMADSMETMQAEHRQHQLDTLLSMAARKQEDST